MSLRARSLLDSDVGRARLKKTAEAIAARVGYEIHRRDHSHGARRAAAMATRGIDVVLDVGANEGQYVRLLRDFGYEGRIVSFEPLESAFRVLAEAFSADKRWTGVSAAVGEGESVAELRVGRSTLTSSLLTATDELRSRIKAAETDYSVEVRVLALDDVWSEYVAPYETAMLKIDVQGFEHQVLDGARESLARLLLIEAEMALVPLYDGGSTVDDLLPRLRSEGFGVISVDSGFVDVATGQVLDIDVLLDGGVNASRT